MRNSGIVGAVGGLLVVAMGCAAGVVVEESDGAPAGAEVRCRGECIQPPLLQDEVEPLLAREQERILRREDYKKIVPPKVTEVAYGLPPQGALRGGEVFGDDGEPYDGALNWHVVPREVVDTESTPLQTFRRREVSGAHCFFARAPNYRTELFALLVVHHPHRGDQLYLGGPQHRPERADTVPLTDRDGPLKVGEEIYCAFRDDQNIVGALIVPYSSPRAMPPNGSQYAAFLITTSARRRPTGQTTTTPRAGGPGGAPEDTVVFLEEYLPPRVELLGAFSSLYEALHAAEEAIPAGRFRLRPEFVYPRMPYLSYLGHGGEPQFCPLYTDCEVPSRFLDADIRPVFRLREELEDWQKEELEAIREKE